MAPYAAPYAAFVRQTPANSRKLNKIFLDICLRVVYTSQQYKAVTERKIPSLSIVGEDAGDQRDCGCCKQLLKEYVNTLLS